MNTENARSTKVCLYLVFTQKHTSESSFDNNIQIRFYHCTELVAPAAKLHISLILLIWNEKYIFL